MTSNAVSVELARVVVPSMVDDSESGHSKKPNPLRVPAEDVEEPPAVTVPLTVADSRRSWILFAIMSNLPFFPEPDGATAILMCTVVTKSGAVGKMGPR